MSQKKWQEWVTHITKTLKLKRPFELSIAVVGDTAMRRLNKTYRGKDSVTDVLSFGEIDSSDMHAQQQELLGEIIICYPQAVRQAKKAGHSISEELKLLLTHGFLHLLGHDHIKSADAKKMRNLEEKILGKTMII